MRIDQVTKQLAEIQGAGMPISSGQRTGGGKGGSGGDGSESNERENGDDNEEEEDAEYEYDDE